MQLDFKKLDGLLPAVIQDHATGRVLMVGFMNEEAFRRTVETGYATFFSRSRNKLWLKGESSGHKLVVKHIATDCDLDALLIQVEALGPGVCHEGYQGCFFRKLESGEWPASEPRAEASDAVYASKSLNSSWGFPRAAWKTRPLTLSAARASTSPPVRVRFFPRLTLPK